MATSQREPLKKATIDREPEKTREEAKVSFDGNAARRLSAAPQIEPKQPERVPQKRPEKKPSVRPSHRQLQKNRRRALAMTPWELCILAIGVIIFAAVAVDYLRVQTQMDAKLKDIQVLEKNVATITLQNDAKELEIKAGIDYQAIYDTATKELGMYYPGKDQVIYYQTSDGEYVEINTNIPN